MRRTKAEQIIDVRKAIVQNPGATLTGVAGISRISNTAAREILAAMKGNKMITTKHKRIFWDPKWSQDEPEPHGVISDNVLGGK